MAFRSEVEDGNQLNAPHLTLPYNCCCFQLNNVQVCICNRVAFTNSLSQTHCSSLCLCPYSIHPVSAKVLLRSTDTRWHVYLLTDSVCFCCQINHGRNKWIHSSLGSYNSTQLERNVPFSSENKTVRKTERCRKNKDQIHSLPSAALDCGPADLDASHFFCEGDRINSKLVYAVPKINLIQKGSGGQRHHLPCPLRQIIAKIVSTLCTQELKLEMLTIQYSKGFCCPFPRIVLLSRHGPSAEENNSWQVEASPWWC